MRKIVKVNNNREIIAGRKRNGLLIKNFIKDLEGGVVKDGDILELVSGQRCLKERNLEILKKIAGGADIRDVEFQKEVGLSYGILKKLEDDNLDVIYQLLSGETPQRRAIWRRLEYRRLYNRASKEKMKHDALDVLSEYRKEDQGEMGIGGGTTNIGIQVYIPQVAEEANFDELVTKLSIKKDIVEVDSAV